MGKTVSSSRSRSGVTQASEGASERRETKSKDGPDLGDERLAAVARRVELGAVRLEGADVVLSGRSEDNPESESVA